MYPVRRRTDGGSVGLETALVMPWVLFVILFFVRLLQSVCAQNCVDRAAARTADLLEKYAIVYHEYGVGALEKTVLERFCAENRAEAGILQRCGILGNLSEPVNNAAYRKTAELIFRYYVEQDAWIRCGYVRLSEVDCGESRFFENGGEDIFLCVKCRACGFLRIGTSLRFRVWIRGDYPFTALAESGISVWTMHNFTRGKIIRDVFGANLPYDYPVIAYFKDGEARMIKSMDITKATYRDAAAFKRELEEMLSRFAAFSGTKGNPAVAEKLQIAAADIRKRTLLLVFPTNRMTEEQSRALLNVMTADAALRNIQIEIHLYQEAPES